MDLYSIRKELNSGIPLANIPLRVTDYARVSTDHLEQKKSLQNQREHFEQYIKGNPHWTYIEGYVDDGISGTSDVKRDNFMKMIADARLGKFDLIITKEISRFSRNTLDSIKYTRELLNHGVAVFFVNDNINTAMPDSELRLTIMASMAQDEIRRLSERVKFGMNRAIERGEILGNDMLYGYKKDRTNNTLKIVPEEAKVVKKIYELYAIQELTLSQIVKNLNRECLSSQNKKWCIATISRMIANPKYKGYYCAKKSEIIDYMTKKIKYFPQEDWVLYKDKTKIPPIIDEGLWERANARLKARQQAFKMRQTNKNIYQNRYVYSAKIYCAQHNTIFHRRIFRRTQKDVTWVCAEYLKNGKNSCNSPSIRESELNAIFKDLIAKLHFNINGIITILMNYYNHFTGEEYEDERLQSLEKEISQILTKKDKILELTIQNRISNAEFASKNNLFNEKLQKLKLELANLKANQTNPHNFNIELFQILQQKILNTETFNKIINLLLEHITVHKINDDKNNMVLDIYLSYQFANISTPFIKSNYTFKRGYDTIGTKRYQVFYQVNCY